MDKHSSGNKYTPILLTTVKKPVGTEMVLLVVLHLLQLRSLEASLRSSVLEMKFEKDLAIMITGEKQ